MGLIDFTHKLLAQNKNEMGIKPIDVYSTSHILMGVVSYLLFLCFLSIWYWEGNDLRWITLTSVIVWGVLWEFLENFLLIKLKLKFANRKDSLENSLTDIVFTMIGAIIGMVSNELIFIFIISFIIGLLYNWVYYKHAMG